MYCDNCGEKLPDDTKFCPNCGNWVKKQHKSVYLALLLTFILTGCGTIYTGNLKKGLIILAVRIALIVIGVFVNLFLILSMFVWAFAFYAAYRDVQIANGNDNPKLLNDFKGWNRNNRIIAVLIVAIILIFTIGGCLSVASLNDHSSDYSSTHYYVSDGGGSSSSSSHYSGGSSSSSSHYGGVDDSPHTIAKNDPDWYYDHYEYGDNPDIDDDLESQGYD